MPTRFRFPCAFAAAFACGVAVAQPVSDLPRGKAFPFERHALENVGWSAAGTAVPVSFRFLAEDEGHEIALTQVHVVIVGPLGRALFEGVSEGPFLMANVPHGRYEVIASHEGQSRRVALDVVDDDALLVAIHW